MRKFVVIPTVALTLALSSFGCASVAGSARPDGGFRHAWTARLDANADSTTIVAPDVVLKNGKQIAVALVVAGNNGSDCDPSDPVSKATTYAFNALTGKRLWQKSTAGRARCTTAAPAVWENWVFSPGLDGKIHRYSLATGAEYRKDGWPKKFTRRPYVEKASANLVVSANYLYLATSGFIGDAGYYEGHVVTIDLLTNHENVWNSLCSNVHALISEKSASKDYCADVQAGMFGRGQGAVDPLNGDVYFATGNGPWNGTTDWGDSVLKLTPDGSTLLDAFTPKNQDYLNSNDLDLGSTGPLILPPVTSDGRTYHLLVQGGKGPSTSSGGPAVLWLVNRDQMSTAPGPGHLGGSLQHVDSPGGCETLTAPAMWMDPEGQLVVIYANDCGAIAYTLTTSLTAAPSLVERWHFGGRSTTPVVSGDSLYIAHDGDVDIYNPSNGQDVATTETAMGSVHWEYPAVWGKWIFMTDESARLFAYKQG